MRRARAIWNVGLLRAAASAQRLGKRHVREVGLQRRLAAGGLYDGHGVARVLFGGLGVAVVGRGERERGELPAPQRGAFRDAHERHDVSVQRLALPGEPQHRRELARVAGTGLRVAGRALPDRPALGDCPADVAVIRAQSHHLEQLQDAGRVAVGLERVKPLRDQPQVATLQRRAERVQRVAEGPEPAAVPRHPVEQPQNRHVAALAKELPPRRAQQARCRFAVAGGRRVLDRILGDALAFEPLRRAAVQPRHAERLAPPQISLKQLREELVVAHPSLAAAAIDRDDEEVGPKNLVEQRARSRIVEDGGAQRGVHTMQHGGPAQEVTDRRRNRVEHLLDEVGGDARRPGKRRGDVLTVAFVTQRGGDERQPGRPTFDMRADLLHLTGIQPQPQRPGEQLMSLVGVKSEIGRVQLGHRPGGATAAEPQRRQLAAGDDDADPVRQAVGQRDQQTMAALVDDRVVIVEDKGQPAAGGCLGERPGDERDNRLDEVRTAEQRLLGLPDDPRPDTIEGGHHLGEQALWIVVLVVQRDPRAATFEPLHQSASAVVLP